MLRLVLLKCLNYNIMKVSGFFSENVGEAKANLRTSA